MTDDSLLLLYARMRYGERALHIIRAEEEEEEGEEEEERGKKEKEKEMGNGGPCVAHNFQPFS